MSSIRSFCLHALCVLIINNYRYVKSHDEDMLQEASEYLLSGANLRANPCENFFNYSCGSWFKNARKIFKSASGGNEEFELWARKTNQLLAESLEAHRAKKGSLKPKDKADYVKWTLAFYDQCLTSNKSTKLTKVELLHIYRYIGERLGYPDILKSAYEGSAHDNVQSVWKIQADMQKFFGLGLLFETEIGSTISPCEEETYTFKFTPLKPIPDVKAEIILQQIENLTQHLGLRIDYGKLSDMVQKIVNLSSALNILINNNTVIPAASEEIELTDDEGEGTDDNEKVYDFEELAIISDNSIEWPKFFKFLLTKQQFTEYNYTDEHFLLTNEGYFSSLNNILTTYDYDTFLTFAFWRVMKEKYTQFRTDDDEEEEASVSQESKAFKCLDLLKRHSATATTRMIFDYKGWDLTHWRTDLELFFETLRASFKFLVLSADWLDNEDKMNVIKKANHISFYSGIPSWLDNDTEVNRRTSEVDSTKSVLENALNVHHKVFTLKLDQVVSGVIDEDEEPDFDVNAYYGPMRIELKLGHTLPPVYHPDYPMAIKYGLLGWVLGHELFHGFDANHIDEAPPKVPFLLKDEGLRAYKRKQPCLQKQISSYCFIRKDRCVSGKQTLAETMADVDGLKIAFMAYKFASLTQTTDPPIPGLISLSSDKIFFLTAGRSYCTNNLNLGRYFDNLEEEHAPSQTRMRISIRNFRAFAKTFKCPLGSVEAPMRTCKIWGDYYADAPFFRL